MCSIEEQVAYEQGQTAFRNGWTPRTNPYYRSTLAEHWLLGYNRAHEISLYEFEDETFDEEEEYA